MNYDVMDQNVLRSIPPVALMTYLSESGWVLQRKTETLNIYRKTFFSSWEEIMVPNSSTYSDYVQMILLALETLSKTESRAERDILSDVISGNVNDVLQYRLMVGDSSGTAPLDWILQLLQAHKRMSAAAYLDMIDPQSYHASLSKGNKVLKDMRVGQTSYGSYVVRMYFPSVSGTGRTADDPLHRIVERILQSSRTVVESAADGTPIGKDDGISYNFIDSFMSLRSDNGYDLEMSGSGPADKPRPTLNVPDSVFPRIENIIDELRPRAIDEHRKFSGRLYAVQEIEYDEQISRFKLEYFDESGSAKASVVLDGQDRKVAMESLRDHSLVSLEGRLSGYGNGKTIEDVRGLHIVD